MSSQPKGVEPVKAVVVLFNPEQEVVGTMPYVPTWSPEGHLKYWNSLRTRKATFCQAFNVELVQEMHEQNIVTK